MPMPCRGGAAKQAGLRAEVDLRNEKINYRREHRQDPRQLVVGKREAEEKTSLRWQGVHAAGGAAAEAGRCWRRR
jgi:threonyl-tRNA synthetase